MKKITAFIFVLLFFVNAVKAQYVNIPDGNFRAFLISKYPSCFNSAGMMDTTCNSIITAGDLTVVGKEIVNLSGVEYFKSITFLDCRYNKIKYLKRLPQSLIDLFCSNNFLDSLPALPSSLRHIYAWNNKLVFLPKLPDSLENLTCTQNRLTFMPLLPSRLIGLRCDTNFITSLPALPITLQYLNCSNNLLIYLPSLPQKLGQLNCSNNLIKALPNYNDSLRYLYCSNNKLESLFELPSVMTDLDCSLNSQLSCLPHLPGSLINLWIYGTDIHCLPNYPNNLVMLSFPSSKKPLCTIMNNLNKCHSFPQIQSNIFIDNNLNGIRDSNETYIKNVKVQLSNSNYAYTNFNGQFQIVADSLGVYTLTIIPPPFYTAVPSTINLNFSSYDTLVNLPDIALKPNTLIDSVSIKATPINWAARPGFRYAYNIQYENIGTTILSPNINFSYDNSLLTYDSSSNNAVVNNGSSLSLSTGNLLQGQTGSVIAHFKVKTTAALGTDLLSVASISGGTSNAIDSVKSVIRGSYDPNDKQATQTITKQDVVDGKFINYTIRFQNTGTDTAFNVVVADTLSSMLELSDFQVVSTSHLCKTTINGKFVYFEFADINLPDSGTNKLGSNGFINFKIRPLSTVSVGTIITNKAYIYFDYNSSIKTNIATTTIVNPLPLKLVLFNAIASENNNLLVYWNTANEVNTAYFILEKSIDGNHFLPIAEIAAKGSGDNSYFYSTPKNGKTFLRLRIVDKDGVVSYSKIIFIGERTHQHISISPNPAKRYLNITVNSINASNLKSKLVNSIGMVVKSFTLKPGFESIDINNLATGVYYLETGLETIKVFVEK
ncbi:MAG: DUF7619 domain-containing protein [Chitinophagaceae bacterium]